MSCPHNTFSSTLCISLSTKYKYQWQNIPPQQAALNGLIYCTKTKINNSPLQGSQGNEF